MLKASTVCILQEERLRYESYQKAVFDSLRLNKENEKHIKTFHTLIEVEKPKSEELREEIRKVRDVDLVKYRN